MPARRATLKDVSRHAGVSLFTASRAMSGGAGVAEHTQTHVREVASHLGYVANRHARNLKGLRSQVIGVIAASKANQYYATLVGALETAVETHGYSCFVADAVSGGTYLPEREDRIVSSFIEQRVAAVVVTCAIAERNLELLESWRIPILFVDCLPPSPNRHPCVSTDNFAASLVMGRHLASLDYARWCFLAHASTWNTREPRQRGFEAAATECGATLSVLEGGNDPETARSAVRAMLASTDEALQPRALFASNTVLLQGALAALRERAVSIPGGMAVVAFDDFEWAPLLEPPITVVDQHIDIIGSTAGSQLLHLLGETGKRELRPLNTEVAPTLVVRRSCGAALPRSERAGWKDVEQRG